MGHRGIGGGTKAHLACNAPGVFRLAENSHLNVPVAEQVNVVVLKTSAKVQVLLHGIKADVRGVGRRDGSCLERKIVEQKDKLTASILVDVQETVAGRKGQRLNI
jgi:hypothetical protein